MTRTILHADMDAFYASVEQRDDPSLRGRPVAVGGPARRGVVAAASYEARRYGVRSAMPVARALRLCPELAVIEPRFAVYSEISERVFAIFASYTPLVEPLSLDEAFLDLSGTERLQGDALEVARAIKARVRSELELVVSVGIGPNKLIAKIASDLGKPDGLVVVRPEEARAFLHPLPVGRLFGVGQVTERRLHELGIRSVGELAAYPRDGLVSRLGSLGGELWSEAQAEDERPVVVDRPPESIGAEDTFADDLSTLEELEPRVQEQADRVARRLRADGFRARVIVLKVKTADFVLRTRRRSLPWPTSDGAVIHRVACELLRKLWQHLQRGPGLGAVRLTGVAAGGLSAGDEPRQLCFDEPAAEEGERLGRTLDEISARFGERALIRGSTLDRNPRRRGPGGDGRSDQ
jgi:DNA polymerase-4